MRILIRELWKRLTYHKYASSIGSVQIRHHRGISCRLVNLLTLELKSVLRYVAARRSVEIPPFFFTVEPCRVTRKGPIMTVTPGGKFVVRSFFSWSSYEIRLEVWPEGHQMSREYTRFLAHETDHLIWWLLNGEFDENLPKEEHPHEIAAREFAESYVEHRYGRTLAKGCV